MNLWLQLDCDEAPDGPWRAVALPSETDSGQMLCPAAAALGFSLQRRVQPPTAAVTGLSGAGGSAGGAARRPQLQVLGDGSMQVPGGGTGCQGEHPGVTDGLLGRQAGCRLLLHQALDEVLGLVGRGGPRLQTGSGRSRR